MSDKRVFLLFSGKGGYPKHSKGMLRGDGLGRCGGDRTSYQLLCDAKMTGRGKDDSGKIFKGTTSSKKRQQDIGMSKKIVEGKLCNRSFKFA